MAAAAVRHVLEHSGEVTEWPAAPRDVIDALVARAEAAGEGVAWEGWPMGSDLGDDTGGGLAVLVREVRGPLLTNLLSSMVNRAVAGCLESDPPRAQRALSLYRALPIHALVSSTVDATLLALCRGSAAAVADPDDVNSNRIDVDVAGDGDEAANGASRGPGQCRSGRAVALDILERHGVRHGAVNDTTGIRQQVSPEVAEAVLRACTQEACAIARKWDYDTLRRIQPLAVELVSASERIHAPMFVVVHTIMHSLVKLHHWLELRKLVSVCERKLALPGEQRGGRARATASEELTPVAAKELTKLLGQVIHSFAFLASSGPSRVEPWRGSKEFAIRAVKMLKRMETSDLPPNGHHYGAAINACASCLPHPLVDDIFDIFGRMQGRSDLSHGELEVAYGGLFKAFAHAHLGNKAIIVLEKMLSNSSLPTPNAIHYHFAVQACIKSKMVEEAARLLITAPSSLEWDPTSPTFDRIFQAVDAAVTRREETLAQAVSRVGGATGRSSSVTVLLPLLRRMKSDGCYTADKWHFQVALNEARSHQWAGNKDAVEVLRMMTAAGHRPSHGNCRLALEWCSDADLADEVFGIMRASGSGDVEWDDAAHVLLLKAYHRSDPPAWRRAVDHLVSVVETAPAGASVSPALYQAVIRACVNAKPAQLEWALKVVDLMVDQSAPPNLHTLALLIRCCRRANQPEDAEALWLQHAPKSTNVQQLDGGRYQEALDELALAVGQARASELAAQR